MNDLIEKLNSALKEGLNYFQLLKSVALKPKWYTQHNTPGLRQSITFLTISAFILVLTEYPTAKNIPPIILGPEGWSPWLSSEAERISFTHGETILSVLNILDWLWFLAVIIFGLSVVCYALARLFKKKVSFSVLFQKFTIPLASSEVLANLFLVIITFLARFEWLGNIAFLVITIPLLIGSFYVAYVIPIGAVIGALKFGISSSTITYFSSIAVGITLFFMINPVAWYTEAIGNGNRQERASVLIDKAYQKIQINDTQNAIDDAEEALELSPRNIGAELVILAALDNRFRESIRDYLEMNDQEHQSFSQPNQETKILIMNIVKDFQDLFSRLEVNEKKYYDLSTVQLYIAESYYEFKYCDRAETNYLTVLRMSNSLPHERAIAAKRLSCISEDNEDMLDDSIWYPKESSNLESFIISYRINLATFSSIGLSLLIIDLIEGKESNIRQSIYAHLKPVYEQECSCDPKSGVPILLDTFESVYNDE